MLISIVKRYFLFLCLSGIVLYFQSCLENDFSYPIEKMYVTSVKVEGQIGESVISQDDRVVTVELADTVNIKKVRIESIEVTEGGRLSFPLDTLLDLSNPFLFNVSKYQDYQWALIANQNMNYSFLVKGQVGNSIFYPELKKASAFVSSKQGLAWLEVTDLKLGPTGAVYNDGNPIDIKPVEGKNYASAEVRVKYKDFFDEIWTLDVYTTDLEVETKSANAWAYYAKLYGVGLEDADNGFEYKKTTDSEWIKVSGDDVVFNNGVFEASVTGLQPNTNYVFKAYSDGAYGDEMNFTTEEALQLPNSSFESVSGDSPLYLFGEGEEMWWDSGNHGSATLNRNVTTVDTSIKHSGNQSLLLSSQNVVIKFAAGNVFAGKYLKTDGTDGILGFGRPFTSRPTKLKGYIKYNCGVVDKGGDKITNGQNDKGTVYVALTDGDGVAYDDGSKWSCIIKTKTGQLFDKNASNVFAYGEMILNESTEGDGLIPFEIKLDYKATDRVPTRIVIVASASYYGDFFQGSTSSKMWLDDITLEYDYE